MNPHMISSEGMLPITQLRKVLQGLYLIFPNTKAKKPESIYIHQQAGASIQKMISSSKYPTIIQSQGELIFAFGGEFVKSSPLPTTQQQCGKKLVQYLSLFYSLDIKYPTGLESGFLMLQALLFGEKDILPADMKLSGLQAHMQSFNKHFKT